MEKDHSNGRNFSNETLMGAARHLLTKQITPVSLLLKIIVLA